eukprot:2304979-Pleurochrysis_carterae.AAC.1
MEPRAACPAGAPSSSRNFRARLMTAAEPPKVQCVCDRPHRHAACGSRRLRALARRASTAFCLRRRGCCSERVRHCRRVVVSTYYAAHEACQLQRWHVVCVRGGDPHGVQRGGAARAVGVVETADQPLFRD